MTALCLIGGLALAGCNGHTPKGQVVAVVNGQEITGQDVASEQRAAGGRDRQAVLQRVVARVLLAQAAHSKHLDSYPGYPADIARLQQDFLAQKLVQQTVKAPPKPSPADVAAFMAAHPFAFKDRMRIQLDEIRFQSADDLRSLNGADTLDAVTHRLKELNAPVDRQTATVDTAQLPPDLAARLAEEPLDKMFYVKLPDATLAIAVKSRDAVDLPPADTQAMASQLLMRIATDRQIAEQVNALQSHAKITYQPGYAPPKPAAAATQPAGSPSAGPQAAGAGAG